MNRSRYFILGAAILFLLLAMASCNWPGSTPDETDTPEGGGAATEPVDVTTIPAPPPANTDGAEVILIPGATFWMGSDPVDAQADVDEFPRHQVALSGFYIYTHEVTNAMYAECVAAGACVPVQKMDSGPTTHYDDPAYAEHPVAGADWNMAHDYCTWAGGRLPTEAEWELASRGAESLRYPWGEAEPACDRANMLGCNVPPDTLAVGSLANGNSPYEAWDMSGNVWEWVNDWYDEDYYQLSPANNPLGPYYSETKVLRGGGLYSEPTQMRSATRVGADPQHAYDDAGFRCVPEAEELPPDYYAPGDGHEWTDPDPLDGGGDTVEDPDDEFGDYAFDHPVVTCPDAEGRIHIIAEASASMPGEWGMFVEGVPFDCTYDVATGHLDCVGPAPATTERPGQYYVNAYFPGPEGVPLNFLWYLDIPDDCPTPTTGVSIVWWADCPVGDSVTVHYEFEPAAVVDAVQLEGVDIPFVTTAAGIDFVVPDRPVGEEWHVILFGTTVAGYSFDGFNFVVHPHLDCLPTAFMPGVEPSCFEGTAGVEVTYPPDIIGLTSVSTIGVPMACIGLAPGVEFCGSLPGAPGSATTVTTCWSDGDCRDWPMVVADCSAGERAVFPTCGEGGPMIQINYDPAVAELVSAANAAGPLPCTGWAPGVQTCGPLPGEVGSSQQVIICFEGEACTDWWVTIPSCDEEEPFDYWDLIDSGCHNENMIYFTVDTYYDWLVPGAEFTYGAWDGETEYTCSVHPTVPGRLYCAGDRPGAPDTLILCVQRTGETAICIYFDEFPGVVSAIPACGTEVPPDDQPGDACNAYTNFNDCSMHTNCHWSNGLCVSNP